MQIDTVDIVGIPSTDTERSRAFGGEFQPQANGIALLHVDNVAAARTELEAKGVEFDGKSLDTGVCHMAICSDPDGNKLVLHNRYAPFTG